MQTLLRRVRPLPYLVLKHWRGLAGALLLFGFFFIICVGRLDPDFGWHLAAGRYILAHGVPATDPFSLTMSKFRWVDHEWLQDVLWAGVYHLGGYRLLAVMWAALWTAGVLLVTRTRSWVVVGLTAGVLAPFAGIRAAIWGLLGVGLVEWLVASKWRQRYVAIIGLFLIWANVHASFVFGLGVLGLGVVMDRAKDRRLVWATGLAVLASLLNPYGWQVYLEVWRTASDRQLAGRVFEWAPNALRPAYLVFVLLLVCLVLSLEGWRSWRRYLVAGLTLVMSLVSMRHTVLFVAASSRHLGRLYRVAANKLRGRLQLAFVAKYTLVVAVILPTVLGSQLRYDRESHYAGRYVAYAQDHPCAGNVFTTYDNNGYLIWKLPGFRSYIDGRMPSWKDGEGKIFDRYLRVFNDPTYRDLEFRRFNIACVVVLQVDESLTHRIQEQFFADLRAQGWQDIPAMGSYVVLARP